MKTATRSLTVDARHPDPRIIEEAAAVIRSGGVVAFPTETVYGLGANALEAASVERIFRAKQRPHTDPLIVHLADVDQLDTVASEVPTLARRLATVFWPGPLTMIFKRGLRVPSNISAGRETVAVRVPAHPVALALLRACRCPVAAPSANLFGRTSPTTAQHVLTDLDGRIDMVLDGGAANIGVESTVVDLTESPPILRRPGGVTAECLLSEVPNLRLPVAPEVAGDLNPVTSPGLLLKHYSPRAMVILLRGEPEAASRLADRVARFLAERGLRTAVLCSADEQSLYRGLPVCVADLGPLSDLGIAARTLFARMRALDDESYDVILAREPDAVGLGLAIRDRLYRAAEGAVLDERQPTDLDVVFRSVLGLLPEARRAHTGPI